MLQNTTILISVEYWSSEGHLLVERMTRASLHMISQNVILFVNIYCRSSFRVRDNILEVLVFTMD